MLPLLLPDAPVVRDAGGDADTVLLELSVEEGVGAAVPVPVNVALPVAVPLGVWLGETLLLLEMLELLLAEAPAVREGVALADTVELALRVLEGVLAPVLLPVCVPLPVAVLLGLWLGVALLDSEMLPLLLADAPVVRDAVGDADTVLLPLTVEDGVGCAVPVPV